MQATWAMAIALAAVLPVAGAVTLLLRNYRRELGAITYRPDSAYLPALAACLVTGALLAAVAVALGFNSAGHRRNDKGARSWFGFFVGGVCLTLAIVVAMAFLMLRL